MTTCNHDTKILHACTTNCTIFVCVIQIMQNANEVLGTYLMQVELTGWECVLPHDVTARAGLDQFGAPVSIRGGRHRDEVDVNKDLG